MRLQNDDTFDLMEFGKMSRVKRFVSENFVEREIFHGLESAFLISELVQHPSADDCRVSSQHVLLGIVKLTTLSVSNQTVSSFLVSFFE
jgi:hypothetical protein